MRLALFMAALIGPCWIFAGEAGSQTVIITGQGQVIGNGRLTSEERLIPTVDEIILNGAFELTILVGRPPQLSLTGEENILPIIKTAVSGSRLNISSDQSFTSNRAIRITVGAPHLARLRAS